MLLTKKIDIGGQQYDYIFRWDDINASDHKFWTSRDYFAKQLVRMESILTNSGNGKQRTISEKCKLCDFVSPHGYLFNAGSYAWTSILCHYVIEHNVKPPTKFMVCILNLYGIHINVLFARIRTNQMQILDALMESGGRMPRYKEKHEIDFKYSEHAGILSFRNGLLDRITIVAEKPQVHDNDYDIYIPVINPKKGKYSYIFHTHPPTPMPGDRVDENMLMEFPSTSDIFHFIKFFNNKRIQGSIIIAPEGLYNIHKHIHDDGSIVIDKAFAGKLRKIFDKVQSMMIKKYEKNISDMHMYYSIIIRDTEGIRKINKLLGKYNLVIDYFPRQLAKNGNWVIGTVFLPLISGAK